MNRLFAFVAVIAICMTASACGGSSEETGETSEPVSASEAVETAAARDAVNQQVFETPVESSSIIGKWQNDENSVSIEFKGDGTYVNDSIEGTYTLNGNTLTLTYYGGEVSEDYSIGFLGEQLVLVRDDMQLIFERSE